jgi:hypothetical protein
LMSDSSLALRIMLPIFYPPGRSTSVRAAVRGSVRLDCT